MNKIFLNMLKLSMPYYQKGRKHDIEHVEWMVKQSDKIADTEKINKKLLLPLVILHDVGYADLKSRNKHCKDGEQKKEHMKKSAKIAEKILTKLHYDQKLKSQIIQCISVHDSWALGDDSPYKQKEMALFNDLDFLWFFFNKNAFEYFAEIIKMKPKDAVSFWINDEKHVRRPFCCKATRKLWQQALKNMNKWYNQRVSKE